ncbi:putative late blight resistance protein homolog R1A-3 [Salvia miltiorrhiza]|uniref:putative late blight resistance protein homolog R1A-3 n=1 Tax=Salvia miltiorrhiza TaxID=226208 RepID=UPI0025AC5D25|nr:putative late blight resistance protein homolog R1A-3 [Salvia miltiorrhiza]
MKEATLTICIPKKGYRSEGVVEKFNSLRVLQVLRRNNNWDWKPGQVFDLVHLTYLASNIPNSIVPSAISKLQNLQTLIIYRSEELSLATDLVCNKRMVEMIPNIKKLGICYTKEKFDADAGYCLNNLKFFCLLEKLKLEKHDDFSCRQLDLLGSNMRGIFSSRQLDELGLEMRGGFSSRQLDELGFMMRGVSSSRQIDELELKMPGVFSSGQLDELRLEMRGDLSSRQFDEIGGLNFPLQLRRLTLSGWRLSWSHMKIIGSLPNLQVLKLRNYACQGSLWITTEGEFRELRLLLIDRSGLVDWITEASHFPRLECLILRQCHDLYKIPSNIGYIPTLKLIEVEKRSLLSSAEVIEKMQRDSGNDSFQVRVKHSGYTDRSVTG